MSAENHRKLSKFRGLTGLISASFALAFCTVGCSIVAQEQSSTASSTTVLLPWMSNGEYRFERVGLNSLVSVSNLQGTAALFLLGPSVANNKLVGFQPRVRTFIDSEGAHVPTDSSSIQLLTLYAHLEKLEDMDRSLGLGDLLPKPRVVGVEVRTAARANVRGQIQNNALYSPALDALLFVPFKGDDLPLAVNAGVIAHEHFHALFNYIVLRSVKEKLKVDAAHVHAEEEIDMAKNFEKLATKITVPNSDLNDVGEWQRYHENLLRGINEGLADVWGWIYTGDPVFVRRSLPGIVEKTRDLDIQGIKLHTMDTFRAYSRGDVLAGSTRTAYELGTRYARILKNSFEDDFKKRGVDRIELAKTLLRVLPKLEKRLTALTKDDWMAPSELLELFASELGNEQTEVCHSILSYAVELEATDIASRCGSEVVMPAVLKADDLKSREPELSKPFVDPELTSGNESPR